MNEAFEGKPAKYDVLYNHAACGLLTFDMSGKILHMNQTLLLWTGLEPSAITEMSFSDLLEKGSQLYFQLFVYPLLKMHGEVKEISMQVQSEHSSFQCLLSAQVLEDPAKSGAWLVHAAIFKVVDRKKFEDELRLRKENAEREKQQKADALKKVASDQSHLVRAPLANLLGLISLLEESSPDHQSDELLSMLKESAMQLDEVIKNIVMTANK